MSIIGTMMMALGGFLPAPRREPEDHELVLEHIARSERELKATREALQEAQEALHATQRERDAWRARHDALLAASHRCQHQAQLNRVGQFNAFEAQQLLGPFQDAIHQVALTVDALNVPCGRALCDCNLHQAELSLQQRAQQALGLRR